MLAGLTSRCNSPAPWAWSSASATAVTIVTTSAGGSPGGNVSRRTLGRVDALDVVHRDPQLVVVFAAVVHTDDVRMPQRGG